jgi:hypothetical protein
MIGNADRKSTGSNFGCTLRCEFSCHSFSQSSSDGTVTSTFVPQSGTTAGQVGVFRVSKMHRLGIVPQRLLREAVSSLPGETGLGSQKSIKNTLCARGKTRAERKGLANLWSRKKIAKKVRACRGHETRWEMLIVCGLSIKDNWTS